MEMCGMMARPAVRLVPLLGARSCCECGAVNGSSGTRATALQILKALFLESICTPTVVQRPHGPAPRGERGEQILRREEPPAHLVGDGQRLGASGSGAAAVARARQCASARAAARSAPRAARNFAHEAPSSRATASRKPRRHRTNARLQNVRRSQARVASAARHFPQHVGRARVVGERGVGVADPPSHGRLRQPTPRRREASRRHMPVGEAGGARRRRRRRRRALPPPHRRRRATASATSAAARWRERSSASRDAARRHRGSDRRSTNAAPGLARCQALACCIALVRRAPA